MKLIDIFYTYFHYFIHPFKTHDYFLNPEAHSEYRPLKLSVYESLGTSWVFIVINGIVRICLLNFVLFMFFQLFKDVNFDYFSIINVKEFPSYYFIVLSSILDVIFFPLFGFFIIQFWEVVIKMFGYLLGTKGDLTEKAQNILTVYLSANILKIIPIFGEPAQSLASMVLMYAGLRKQLNASPALSVCIILFPVFLMLALGSILLLVALTAM